MEKTKRNCDFYTFEQRQKAVNDFYAACPHRKRGCISNTCWKCAVVWMLTNRGEEETQLPKLVYNFERFKSAGEATEAFRMSLKEGDEFNIYSFARWLWLEIDKQEGVQA